MGRDKVDGSGAGCGIHGFSGLCCPASDVGIAWFLGGCHRPAATSVVDWTDGKLASLVFPRILMSGFIAERPFAGSHSAPRARGDNLHGASSCPPRSSTSTSLA